jgi:hypothetical protein
MTQRGISRRLVDFTLRHGRIEGDKHVLDRNESRRLIEELEEELRLARQAHERGGVTVIGSGGSSRRRAPRSKRAQRPTKLDLVADAQHA